MLPRANAGLGEALTAAKNVKSTRNCSPSSASRLSDEMRALIEREWPELVHNLPPKEA
jgi:hypothetical protein